MKRKLTSRYKSSISRLLLESKKEKYSLLEYINFLNSRSNFIMNSRLESRGRLIEDWSKAIYSRGLAVLHVKTAKGVTAHTIVCVDKEDLPLEFQSRWIDEPMKAT